MNLTEAHSLGRVFQGQPDRDVMISRLASDILADVNWQPIEKLSWSDLKARAHQAVAVRGTDGSAVITWDGGSYGVYVGGANPTNGSADNGTEVLAMVKPAVGKIKQLFLAKNISPGDVRDVRRRRKVDIEAQNKMTKERLASTLLNHAPKYIQSALANMAGMAQQMIKVQNYGGARQKLERMQALKTLMIALDRPEGAPVPTSMKNFMTNVLDNAILHTYAYEHPGMVRATRSYRGEQLYPVNPGQFNDWLTHALQRRDATFATILSFLKQEFLTGKFET